LKQAITLLVIACPCALVISTQLHLCRIGNASARGASKRREIHRGHGSSQSDRQNQNHHLWIPKRFDVFPNGTSRQELLACTAELKFSEHPLAQAIVASRAEGFEHTAEAFKSIMGKEPLQDVWFVRTKRFLGKLEFIRENHEVSRRLKRLLNN
jgi:Cd2+/Zn2+-exporting ATPase